ncbi:MAG: TonB-dependent receptor [Sphingobacteriales bacterium]|nr:TonB-dependent receptor [Sphingobacteriales bacterium]
MVLFNFHKSFAQDSLLNKHISISFNKISTIDAIHQLQKVSGISFSYDPIIISNKSILPKAFSDTKIRIILAYLLSNREFIYEEVAQHIVINKIITKYSTLNGIVYDMETGENLIGATLQIEDIKQLTNQYGYFSISLPAHSYVLFISYIGYKTKTISVDLSKDNYLSIALERQSYQLNEVNFKPISLANESVEALSYIKNISINGINKMPYFGGEVDVLKALQNQTGIVNSSEGSSSLSVRGGNFDQNLVLIDEAPIYNPSHLFGLVSVFNIDAVKDVELYNDYIPANFGGRLASVINTKLDEGNLTSFHLKGGLSLLSGRIAAEGPLVKNRSSYLLSVRRSLTDLYNNEFKYSNINANYFDFNLKTNYIINRNSRIYFSIYHGFDHLFSDNEYTNNWSNTTSTLRLNHIYSPQLFSNFSFIFSNYNNTLSFPNFSLKNKNWITGIKDITWKADFTFYKKPENRIQFGAFITNHLFKPGETLHRDSAMSLNRIIALEYAFYYNQEIDLSKVVQINYGLRAGFFNSSETSRQGENGSPTSYFNLEPRFLISFKLNKNQKVKFAYTRNIQNIQVVQNNEQAYSSLETWLPSGPNIKPEKADMISLTYSFWKNKGTILNAAIYYKKLYNQSDILDHTQIILNPSFVNNLKFGMGKAYGFELSLQKSIKKLSAEVGYAYSRSLRSISLINNGNPYPTNFDTPNNLKVNLSYDMGKRLTLSALFNYKSGRSVTLPTGYYIENGIRIPIYDGRNTSRFPNYSRLDIEVILNPKNNKGLYLKKRIWESTWTFGIYNLYNRKNLLFYRINQDQTIKNLGFEESFSGVIPTISYSFKF